MYDNLHMRLATVGAATSTVVSRLSNAKQNIDIETGEVRSFGYLNNLRVSVYESGLQSISTEEIFTPSTERPRSKQCRNYPMS